MKFENKNILLISPEPWNHIFVSKHHYATYLAERRNKVFFLNPPSKQELVEKTNYDKVFSVHYKGFINGLRFLPSVLQKHFIRKKFKKLERLCKAKFDFVWSFDNSVFFDFSALPNNVFCISHIVDLNQDFELKKSSKTANLCLSTSDFLVKKQKKYNSKSYNISHGFNKVRDHISTFQLLGESRINCGYAGNLDIKYIDWDLIESLLDDFPHIDFHFAGEWKSNLEFLHIINRPNFYFYGKLPADDLPSFYKSLDILILVYQYINYPEQLANPHKMMEYLGSGKAIVSTWTEEYVNLIEDGLIKMAKNKKDFKSAFSQAVNNLDYWNRDENKKLRKAFANQYTYENQINRIEKIIQSHS